MAWEVVVHNAAISEMRRFKNTDPACFKQIVTMLQTLSDMPDPRRHRDVCHLKYDAPGWFRLKIRKPRQVRVFFRLLDNNKVEIGPYAILDKEEDEHHIQVLGAVYRSNNTYSQPLHRLYRLVEV